MQADSQASMAESRIDTGVSGIIDLHAYGDADCMSACRA